MCGVIVMPATVRRSEAALLNVLAPLACAYGDRAGADVAARAGGPRPSHWGGGAARHAPSPRGGGGGPPPVRGGGGGSQYAIEPRGEYVFGTVAGQAMRARRGRETHLVRPGQ